ncbi:MAG: PatB family C-S lyase [Bacteroidaceae bacterium]|nr:PatB family C-S lyase [Bacteroidaceae bacterium]
MTKYNFDKIRDRSNTNAVKTEMMQELFGRTDLLPLWVADMDFDTPPCVTEALRKRLEHPIFGYTTLPPGYWQSIAHWIETHHNWKTNEEWYTFIPGIVRGIGMAINVFVEKDEKVIIQPPVYHPFRMTTEENGRTVVYNPLIHNTDGTYSMDFDNLAAVADEKCRMLLLSNPHNPGGIVWDSDTLVRLADFCHRRGIIVVSDEIHCDIALWDNRHTPFATVSKEAAACSITFGAPSKTFNIAGIVSSYAIVPNENLRERFFGWLNANEMNLAPMFAPIATKAAFEEGEEWRQAMLRYIEGNIDYVIKYCAEQIPLITPLRPQASFLIWLDCRALGLNHEQLVDLFVNKAHLALNDGEMFGQGGEGFMRMNVGSPRSIIEQAMEQLRKAIAKQR